MKNLIITLFACLLSITALAQTANPKCSICNGTGDFTQATIVTCPAKETGGCVGGRIIKTEMQDCSLCKGTGEVEVYKKDEMTKIKCTLCKGKKRMPVRKDCGACELCKNGVVTTYSKKECPCVKNN